MKLLFEDGEAYVTKTLIEKQSQIKLLSLGSQIIHYGAIIIF